MEVYTLFDTLRFPLQKETDALKGSIDRLVGYAECVREGSHGGVSQRQRVCAYMHMGCLQFVSASRIHFALIDSRR